MISIKLASVWLNEEWFNAKMVDGNNHSSVSFAAAFMQLFSLLTRFQSPYDTWLAKVLAATAKSVGNDDNTLVEFLLDLPELTPDVLQGIRRISENVDT